MSDQTQVPNTPIKPVPVTRQSAPPDGRDPNVKVPSRVRAEAARSEELMKARQDALDEAMAAGEGGDPALADGTKLVPVAPPAPTRTSVSATPPAPVEPMGKAEEDFNAMKQRFERANRDSIRLSEEVVGLRNVIAAMQVAPVVPAAPPAAPPELQAQSLLTPQEISDYGPEFLDVVGKKAREIAGAEIAALRAQVENLTRGVQTTQQVTAAQARDNMLNTLDEKLPEWRVLNNDQNFLSWLRLPDTYSGAIRQDLLTAAYEQNNPSRVAAFFNGFLSEEAALSPASDVPSASTPIGKVPLETFAAPSRARSAAAHAPAEKPIITRAQVAAFYTEVAAGKYRGRDEEKNRLEAEIFSATSEGRLR